MLRKNPQQQNEEQNEQVLVQSRIQQNESNFNESQNLEIDSQLNKEVKSLLNQAQYQNLIQLINQRKDQIDFFLNFTYNSDLTIVHNLILSQKKQILEEIIKIFKQNNVSQQAIKNLINKQNKEGYAPLHYASYKGDIEAIKYLIQLGADEKIINYNGLSVIHAAVQNDKPISICYFLSQQHEEPSKVKILEQMDYKQAKPLHWACFMEAENCVNLLLSYKVQLNEKDDQGLTPLHIAVTSGNARIVKKLLLRGADKTQKDSEGKTPLKLAEENNFDVIYKMLKDLSLLQKCLNTQQQLKPVRREKKKIFLILLLIFIGLFNYILFIFPYIQNGKYVLLAIVLALNLLNTICMSFSILKSPGYVSLIKQMKKQNNLNIQQVKNNQSNSVNCELSLSNSLITSNINFKTYKSSQNSNLLLTLYQNIAKQDLPDSQICSECKIIKPQRSRHCEICQRCIRVYDHHCPWIDNCVACENLFFYIFFLIFLWILLLFYTVSIIYEFVIIIQKNQIAQFDLQLLSSQSFLAFKYIFLSVCLIVCLMFWIPLNFLLYVQITNILKNQTTFERYNQFAGNGQMEQMADIQLLNRDYENQNACKLSNAYQMLFKNRKNKLYDFDYVENNYNEQN